MTRQPEREPVEVEALVRRVIDSGLVERHDGHRLLRLGRVAHRGRGRCWWAGGLRRRQSTMQLSGVLWLRVRLTAPLVALPAGKEKRVRGMCAAVCRSCDSDSRQGQHAGGFRARTSSDDSGGHLVRGRWAVARSACRAGGGGAEPPHLQTGGTQRRAEAQRELHREVVRVRQGAPGSLQAHTRARSGRVVCRT